MMRWNAGIIPNASTSRTFDRENSFTGRPRGWNKIGSVKKMKRKNGARQGRK
jgi:hypothetical protein